MKTSSAVFGSVLLASLGSSFTVACQRAQPTPSQAEIPAPEQVVTSAQASLSAGTTKPEFKRREAPAKVFAVGDLHGDLQAAKRTFRVAGVLDQNDAWIGGNSVVVQTGDVLDRGNEERPLLEWLERVAQAAETAGGALHRLNGNHEIMNVAGDLRYVTPGGFTAFAEYANGPIPASMSDAPQAHRGRLAAFLPGGYWAKRLANYPVVLQVNDTVFAHGGLTSRHIEYGLERMNSEISAWMRGSRPLPKALQSDDTPFWDRTYGESVSDSDCRMLERVLAQLSAKRLVIGHTPQKQGITFACDRRVVRIDVGLASYYGQNAPAVLEVDGSSLRILTEAEPGESKPPKTSTRPKAAPPVEARP
jgi:hypothetical protein